MVHFRDKLQIIDKFDDIGISIIVNGKTGPRRVRAVWSVDYLRDWFEDHPGQNNPDAPLWFNFAKKTEKFEAMQYGAIRIQLKKSQRKLESQRKFILIY